jgi:hypothetical protein
MRIGSLHNGARGFDANQRITSAQARDAVHKGYRFAVRYVRRAATNAYDVTAGEIAGLLQAGLGLMLVQHVALPGWHATADLGRQYGQTAVLEAARAGYPRGCQLWCDLEGVSPEVPASWVIGYCNAWYAAVALGDFRPGLYVGDSCGLTADQLYRNLRFDAYWSAYNLNRDQYPAVRGVQMRQKVATLEDLIVGLTNDKMDVDVISADARGGTPTLLLP